MTFLTAVVSLLFLSFSTPEKVKMGKKRKRKSNIFLLAGLIVECKELLCLSWASLPALGPLQKETSSSGAQVRTFYFPETVSCHISNNAWYLSAAACSPSQGREGSRQTGPPLQPYIVLATLMKSALRCRVHHLSRCFHMRSQALLQAFFSVIL